MNKIIALLTLLTVFVGATAQITFNHLSLEEAIAKAKKENKKVFVDVYATWCGPCKRMAATAFMNEEVGRFHNEHFINVKIDGEKGDGPAIMEKYGVYAFPTLLYINADGTLFRKMVGMMSEQDLLLRGGEAVHPETSPLFTARQEFHNGNKGREPMAAYINAMAMDDDADSLEHYGRLYYSLFPDLDLKKDVELLIFTMQEKDPQSTLGKYFLEHANEFDPDTYESKIGDWINASFERAVMEKDISIVEKQVALLYPYWEKNGSPGMTQKDLIKNVREAYKKYAEQ